MIIIHLFYEFFIIGLFSVGGGLATLPFLYDLSARTGWFTEIDVVNMLAVSESTPGAIGVNMASYVGYTTAGIPGSIVATIALVSPSVFIIIIIARFLKKFRENELVQSAFYGLRPASTGLIAAAGFGVMKVSLLSLENWSVSFMEIFNWKEIIIAVVLFIVIMKYKKHPVFYIILAALVGILFHLGT